MVVRARARQCNVRYPVRGYYEERIGTRRLEELETRLRDAVHSLELDYLPESWSIQQ